MYSKIQVVTHHYQRFSCSQYLLLVQVQAQQKVYPYFPIEFRFGLLKIKKVFLRLVMGLSTKVSSFRLNEFFL
ncbi:hypothetical protein H5410_021505, partial [Solanum commersonii]